MLRLFFSFILILWGLMGVVRPAYSIETNDRLLDRALTLHSISVFKEYLNRVHLQSSSKRLSDRRGTPLLIALTSLAVPGGKYTPVYESMIAELIRIEPESIFASDRAYVGDGRLAIHQASAVGNLTVMKQLLLRNPKSVNAISATGDTPLHLAARFGHLNAVKYLIQSKAFVNPKTQFTHATPLMEAAEMGHESIIRFLMLSRANRNEKDIFGKTAPDRFREFKVSSASSVSVRK